MTFTPAQYLGQRVPNLIAQLEQLSPEASFVVQGSEVELCCTLATLSEEALTVRPASLLPTTSIDADLPSNHPDVSLPGVVLEQYLGGGGQGWVYAGRVTETGSLIAVKVLRATSAEASQNLALREALICTRVRHPNVLRVFEAVEAGSFWVILMELIQGRELNQEDTQDNCKRIFGQLSTALLELQRQRIVHRDIKPGNILLRSATCAPVLVDFGLAQDLNTSEEVPSVSGTPIFMAPETFASRTVHPAQDAYSLGVTAAVLLTGMPKSYPSLSALHSAKMTGTFDADLRRRLVSVADLEVQRWILDLLDPELTRRLNALQRGTEWVVAA